ncbi:MAG TPA: DUF2127 domain-containing protein [Sphingomicrobium sp.]|nr:DUF2127 domain-containing protein [Sphingomicrobium sp.]
MKARDHASIREKRIHDLFAISVLLKGAHALIEIVGGIALYMLSTKAVVDLLNRFAVGELIEDPKDLVAGQLLKFAEGFSVQAHHFYAFYLLSHGVVKLALVAGLLREKLWAYPASFAVFTAFIGYQLYRFSYTHEISLIALSILDAIVIALAWHEYRLLRRHRPTH